MAVVNEDVDVRTCEKVYITIPEASALFSIGQRNIRSLMKENPCADWIFTVGKWQRIRRKEFEDFLGSLDGI